MTDAIVLGGGRATRLDGADKASVEVDGRRLVDHVYRALRGCDRIVAVGPDSLARPDVTLVREDPPFGGPAAALAAAIDTVTAAEVWLFACDLPRAGDVVDLLRSEPLGDDDGVILADVDGRDQWLAGRYRTTALRAAVNSLGDPTGASLRRLLADLRLRRIPDADGAAIDLDTWADVADYRRRRKEPS